MASPFDQTTQHDAASAGAAPTTDAVALSPGFLDRLRSGERQAFLDFFEAYRIPLFNFVRCFTQTDAEAADVTRETFITTYRRILLREGTIEPRPWLYQAALALCRERGATSVDDGRLLRRARPESDAARETGVVELGRRFGQALQTLDDRHYAVLLLHDLQGLRPEEIATVLGAAAGAGTTLLFQAREAFLRSFNRSAADSGKASCRLAEQVAAGTVGRSLASDELRRLRDHAGYCRPCRKMMRSWGAGPIGLALFLTGAPLPRVLDEAPVFAAAGGQDPTALGAAAGGAVLAEVGAVGAVAAMATGLRRAVASRAAAYALAAACLVAVAGMAVYVSHHDIRLVPEPVSAPIGLLVLPTSRPQEHPSTTRAGRSGAATKTGTTVSAGKSPRPSAAGVRQTAVAVTATLVVTRPTASSGRTTASGSGSGGGGTTTAAGGSSTGGGAQSGGGQSAVGSGTQTGGGQSAVGSGTQTGGGQSAVGGAGPQGSWGRAAGKHGGRAKQRHAGGRPHSWGVPGSHGAAHATSRQYGRHGATRTAKRWRDHQGATRTATRSRSHHGATRTTARWSGHHGIGRGASRAEHGTAHSSTRHGGRHGGRSRGRGRRHHGR
jgi:DNA-directed RNA polymerase specialized sigma24 family protein